MTIKEVLENLCKIIQQTSHIPVKSTFCQQKDFSQASYIFLELVKETALTQGGTFLEEGKLVSRYTSELTIYIHLCGLDTLQKVNLRHSLRKDVLAFYGLFLISLEDLRQNNQKDFENQQNYFLSAILRVDLDQVMQENESFIEKVLVDKSFKEL